MPSADHLRAVVFVAAEFGGDDDASTGDLSFVLVVRALPPCCCRFDFRRLRAVLASVIAVEHVNNGAVSPLPRNNKLEKKRGERLQQIVARPKKPAQQRVTTAARVHARDWVIGSIPSNARTYSVRTTARARTCTLNVASQLSHKYVPSSLTTNDEDDDDV